MNMQQSLSQKWSAPRGIMACAVALAAILCPVVLAGQAPAGSASLDQILKELSTYDGGVNSAAVWKLRDYVYARKDEAVGRAECEAKLLAFIKSPATPVARMAVARHLRVIAGETAVPALRLMLADERLADLALYALQQIPGGVAEGALVQAMKAATGATKISLVTALGERKAAAAVPVIAPLLQQPGFAVSAATALGRIGGQAAASALDTALGGATGALRTAIAGALIEGASGFELGAQSLPIYERLASDKTLPEPQRRAALIGRIRASSDVRQVVTGMLASQDPLAQEAAIARVSVTFLPDSIGPVCALLPKLSDGAQVALIAALSGYPAECVVSGLLESSRSQTEAVRIAALKALGAVGGPAAVGPLAEAASRARGVEQVAARSALGTLKGRAVDDEIVKQLEGNPADGVAGELLLAVGDRRIFPAKPVVSAALLSPSSPIRVQALKSLRAIGTPSDITAVLDLLLKTEGDSERMDAEKTVVALARKIENPDSRSRMIRARLGTEKRVEARVRLIGLLPLIADSSAMPSLRALLEDDDPAVYDAAVRALASWPTPAAREDLLRLARDSRNQTHRLLAIGGLVRVVGLDRYRDPEASVADLRQAAGFAWRPEEQRLVLGALAQFPCRDALDLANGFLREPEVKAEAQAAIDKITPRLKKPFGK